MRGVQLSEGLPGLGATASGEWPLDASIDRGKLRRISSALKDKGLQESPLIAESRPSLKERRSQGPHAHTIVPAPERRAKDVQFSASAKPPASASMAETALAKSPRAGPAGAQNQGTDGDTEQNARQQAVQRLKAMLQSDTRLTRRSSADGETTM